MRFDDREGVEVAMAAEERGAQFNREQVISNQLVTPAPMSVAMQPTLSSSSSTSLEHEMVLQNYVKITPLENGL